LVAAHAACTYVLNDDAYCTLGEGEQLGVDGTGTGVSVQCIVLLLSLCVCVRVLGWRGGGTGGGEGGRVSAIGARVWGGGRVC
jgi:hypothetical protein